MPDERSLFLRAIRRVRSRPPTAAPLAPPKASIRPAGMGDADAVCDFLHRELNGRISPQQWRSLFALPWGDDGEYGHLMEVEGRIVGYVGAILSRREIDGKSEVLCNLTSWCVSAGYRTGLAPISLLMPYVRRKDHILTSLTAGRAMIPIFRKLGFRVLDEEKIISPPLSNPRSMLARVRILSDTDSIRSRLSPQHRQLLDHHLACACSAFLAVRGGEYAFLITKRRVKKGIPVSEVLICTNSRLALSALERLKLRILSCQRTVALVADRRIFGAHQPRGVRVARQTLIRSDGIATGAVDNLYSELAVLPI